MTDKLTPEQKRAIREAKESNGRLWGTSSRIVDELRNKGLCKPDPVLDDVFCLTGEGEAVEVEDE